MSLSKQIESILKESVDEGLKPSNLKKSAKSLRDSIVKRTKLGKGVKETGERLYNLNEKVFTSGYKKERKRLKTQGKLSNSTRPNKHNLTKSGNMLKDIRYKVRNNNITIFPNSQLSRIKIQENDKNGRKFMDISRTELKNFIQDLLGNIIAKARKL